MESNCYHILLRIITYFFIICNFFFIEQEYGQMIVKRTNYLPDRLLRLLTRALRIIQHQLILSLVVFNKQENQKRRKIKMTKMMKKRRGILKQGTVVRGKV